MAFTWDAAEGRYLDAAGNPVPDEVLRESLDSVIDTNSDTMTKITEALVLGALLLASWQAQAMRLSKLVHIQAAALALGGIAQLTDTQQYWLGGVVATQLGFLTAFSRQLASGQQSLGGAVARANLYVEAARSTHREATQRWAKGNAFTLERNVLGAADHCGGCLTAAAQGWVPLGTLTPVGSRNCLSRCRCWLVYRR